MKSQYIYISLDTLDYEDLDDLNEGDKVYYIGVTDGELKHGVEIMLDDDLIDSDNEIRYNITGYLTYNLSGTVHEFEIGDLALRITRKPKNLTVPLTFFKGS